MHRLMVRKHPIVLQHSNHMRHSRLPGLSTRTCPSEARLDRSMWSNWAYLLVAATRVQAAVAACRRCIHNHNPYAWQSIGAGQKAAPRTRSAQRGRRLLRSTAGSCPCPEPLATARALFVLAPVNAPALRDRDEGNINNNNSAELSWRGIQLSNIRCQSPQSSL